MVDEIFQDDPKFSEHQIPKPRDEGVSHGISHLSSGFKSIFLGFFHIFTKKIPMNLFFLLLIIAIAFFGSQFLNDPTTTGATIADLNCSPKVCPKCPEINQTCDEPEILIEKVNVIYVKCPDGKIVNDTKDCAKFPIKVESEDSTVNDKVILSLDWINFSIGADDLYTINRMNVTISNLQTETIFPEIQIKIYEEWDTEIANEFPLRRIRFDNLLNYNGVIKKSEKMILAFEGLPKTIRLELYDTIPDPDVRLAIVTKEISSLSLS